MSTIDEIMSEAQVFASAWSLVGGRFDDGSGLEHAEECKAAMRDLIAAALADARREGAEAMREAAADRIEECDQETERWEYAEFVRALPLPTGERQAVLLTDAAIAEAFLSRCPAHLRGEHDVRDMQARPDVMAMGRAVEAAVLAANNLEVRRG